MWKKFISVALIVPFLSLFFGCGTIPEEHKGAAVGAGVGAAAGTVAGAVIGKSFAGAVVGGLMGGLIGGAIGHYGYDRKKSREETSSKYHYDPSMGTVLRIEGASAVPHTLKPGQEVSLEMTYAVLTPEPKKRIRVTEIREVRYNGELVGKPEVRVDHFDGTYSTSVPIKLPANAKKGDYTVIMKVQTENAKDTREVRFTVG